MAIENLGISETLSGSTLDYVLITAARTPSNVYMRWHTLTGSGTIKSFMVGVALRLVSSSAKGVSESQYTGWSEWSMQEYPISQCNPSADSAGYWWGVPVNVGGIIAKWCPHGWAYSTRDNDEIGLQLYVYAKYEQSYIDATGQEVSAYSWRQVRVSWVPTYSVSAMSFGTSGDLHITFSRPGWSRTDDRYTITKLQSSTADYLSSPISGTVGDGSIRVPSSKLARSVKAGAVYVEMKIDASFRESGWTLATARASLNVADKSSCTLPMLTVTNHGDYFSVKTADSKAGGTVSTQRVFLKLRGYSEDFDSDDVQIGGNATFRFPPLDKSVVVDAVGYAGDDSYSKTVSVTVPTSSGGKSYVQLEDTPTAGFALYYGQEFKRSVSPDREVVKLAGRSKSSAYFGTGAEVSTTLSGKLIDLAGIEQGTPDVAEAVAEAGGVVVVRRPGGYRQRCSIGQLDTSRGPVSPVVDVQLSMDEVV